MNIFDTMLIAMQSPNQDQLKQSVKIWLKAQHLDYAWLAEQCFVSEATVRNWMARKIIPSSKAHIIEQLIRQKPMTLPSRIQVEEETTLTLRLDAETRKLLEARANRQGKTLAEFLAEQLPHLGEPES